MEVNLQRTEPELDRKNRHKYAGIAVIISIFLTNLLLTNFNFRHFFAVTMLSAYPVMAAHILWHTCLFIGELFHVKILCSGSYSALFKRTFALNNLASFCSIPIMLSLTSSDYGTLQQTMQMLGPIPLCLSMCAIVLLYFVIRGEECLTWEAHTMKHLNGLDYGSGMAHSFFHGYLKIILPAKGDNNLSIRDRINNYIEKQSLQESDFPIKKLIILVPSSGYSFPTLCDVPSQISSDRDVEPAEALEAVLRDRAGTKARVYSGCAYRIRVQSEGNQYAFYAVVEGATPLLTFREAYSAGTPQAEHLKSHKRDIVTNFYHTLKSLIDEDPDVSHLAELMYYNDEDNPRSIVLPLLKEYLLQHKREME